AALELCEKAIQRSERLLRPRVDPQLARGNRREVAHALSRPAECGVGLEGLERDGGEALQLRFKLRRIDEELGRREHGALDVVPAVLVARCDSGSKRRMASISSSKRSMRSGAAAPMGKTSKSEPRTANSPGLVTWLTLAYPASASLWRKGSSARACPRVSSKARLCTYCLGGRRCRSVSAATMRQPWRVCGNSKSVRKRSEMMSGCGEKRS